MCKSTFLLTAFGCITLLACFSTVKAQNNVLSLRDEKFSFSPKKFYIADVADKRTKSTVTALLIEKDKASPIPADLRHGAVDAIKNFLRRNLHRDTILLPVLLTINEFKLTETQSTQGEINGDLKINFSFSSQLSYQNKHLVDYRSETHYHRALNDHADVELKLRQGIVAGVSYFHNWINQQNNR